MNNGYLKLARSLDIMLLCPHSCDCSEVICTGCKAHPEPESVKRINDEHDLREQLYDLMNGNEEG